MMMMMMMSKMMMMTMMMRMAVMMMMMTASQRHRKRGARAPLLDLRREDRGGEHALPHHLSVPKVPEGWPAEPGGDEEPEGTEGTQLGKPGVSNPRGTPRLRRVRIDPQHHDGLGVPRPPGVAAVRDNPDGWDFEL